MYGQPLFSKFANAKHQIILTNLKFKMNFNFKLKCSVGMELEKHLSRVFGED